MKKYFLLLAMSMMIIACGKTPSDIKPGPVPDKDQGQLSLSIGKSGSFEIVMSSDMQRAADIDITNFKVEIYDLANQLVKSWDQASKMPELQNLNVGTYKIVAYNTDLKPVAFENPYFYGEKTFEIAVGKVTPVDLTCKLSNMMVSIQYSENFLSFYGDDYKVIIENDSYIVPGDPQLIFMPGDIRPGYTKVAPFKITIKAGGKTQVRAIETVRAQDHHVVFVDIKPIGNASVLITIDKTTNNNDIGIIVPGDDEDLGNGGKPKPDNPTEETLPTIKGVGFNIKNALIISTTTDIENGVCVKPVKAIVSAKDKIQNLIVRIDSPDLGPELLNPMFGGDSFDLANLEDGVRVGLIELGLIKESDVINGSDSFTFDVTGFMTLLPENTIHHKFHITLIDYKGQKEEVVLSINRTI